MTYSSSENKMRKNISVINFSLHSILTDDSLRKFLVWTAFQASAFVQTGVKWTIQRWRKNGTADKRRGPERKVPRKLLQNCLMQPAERKHIEIFEKSIVKTFCYPEYKDIDSYFEGWLKEQQILLTDNPNSLDTLSYKKI